MTNQNQNVEAFIPQYKAPYNNLRADKGNHKRSYTVACFVFLGMANLDEKTGTVSKGPDTATQCDIGQLLGTSASKYWTGKRWIIDGQLSEDGLDTAQKSFKGEAHLVAIPGLVGAYVEALKTGILYNPGTKNVLERFRYPVQLNKATKATTKATTATKATKATTATATKAKATTKATKAKPVLITPKAKV